MTKETKHIPLSKWGKDHWSTLAYIETRIVDHLGIPDFDHMRVDIDVHPGRGNRASANFSKKYPTRLNDGTEVYDHDDWSCLEDAEREGLLEVGGTGLHPVYALTDLGRKVCAALRVHKGSGGVFHDFRWEAEVA